MTLEELYQIIEDRKKNMPKNSYVASLFRENRDRLLQKVGEEAIEVVIAAKNEDTRQFLLEMADLWFHSLVLLASLGIRPEDVFLELEKRKKGK